MKIMNAPTLILDIATLALAANMINQKSENVTQFFMSIFLEASLQYGTGVIADMPGQAITGVGSIISGFGGAVLGYGLA